MTNSMVWMGAPLIYHSIRAPINFFATIINMRCYSMTLSIMPVYTWSIYITGFLLLLTLPILTGALIMLLADLHVNTVFFDPIFRGDPVLYQHLF